MSIDREAIEAAYHDVRSDDTETSWAVFGYNGKAIEHLESGVEYSDFLNHCEADVRFYGFVRIMTGDEMSKRAKFAFVTWIGDGVSVLKKAKVSTDKAFVKEIVRNFAKEILTSDKSELKFERVKAEVEKVGGANYGIGQ